MEPEETKEEMQSFLEKVLEALGLSGDIFFEEVGTSRVRILLKIKEDQQYLIGKQGAALDALQQLVSSIARKNKSNIQYRVDVNDYKEEKKRFLINRVKDYIEEKADDSSVLLWPMSAYERRVIHEYFLEQGGYSTESEDFGAQRVVRIIKK